MGYSFWYRNGVLILVPELVSILVPELVSILVPELVFILVPGGAHRLGRAERAVWAGRRTHSE
jgi:hypothetical protein